MTKIFTIDLKRVFLGLIFLSHVFVSFAQTKEEESKNVVPTMEEVLQGMKQGKKYNLKKILKANVSDDLFTDREDNPQLRQAFDLLRLRDPKTGKIPIGIRERELTYVNSSKSKTNTEGLKIPFQKSSRTMMAPGSQTSDWVNRGPFNVGGRTRALALDINDENRILAGGASGGLWESTDLGLTWTRITPAQEHPTITDIVQDPRDGFQNIWYYGSGEDAGNAGARNFSARFLGNGIYKSTDNGATFNVLAVTTTNTPQGLSTAEPFEIVYNVDINPLNGDLYAATLFGIYRSTDGGTTFDPVLLNGGGTTVSGSITESEIHITSTGIFYATLESNATESGIFRSTTGNPGEWINITDANYPASFGRTVIQTAPSNENVLYVFSSLTSTAPVSLDFWKYTYVSGDGTGAGGTWEDRSANLPNLGGSVGNANTQRGYDAYVRVHPLNENTVFLGTTNIFRSTDGFATPITGAGWIAGYSPLNNVTLYTNHHPDQHALVFFPSNPNMAISGHDGGLSLTSDVLAANAGVEPVAWTSLNNGYLTTQAYAVSFGPGNQIMVGFQDNSTWLTTSDSPTATWTDEFSGDGSYNAFNSDGTLRYVSSQNGNVFRLTYSDANSDVATNFQSIRPPATVVAGSFIGLFVNPFELDPNNDEIMYFPAGSTLWRNDDLPNATGTVGWTNLTNAAASSGSISTISISKIPSNVVYYGTTTGGVYRIDNANTGNPTAIDLFTGKNLPTGNVSSIAIDPTNSDNVLVTFSNYSIPSIFSTSDAGATWVDVSGNLEENVDGSGSGPSIRSLSIVGRNDLYLVGSSTGMYSTSTIDGAATIWTQVDTDGIGNVVVEQIRSREDGLVVAGTYGNGIYSGEFEVTAPPVTVQNALVDYSVESNASDTTIDISNVFLSALDVPLDITVSVETNTNTGLISTSITGDILTISYTVDGFGDALITLKGDDGSDGVALSSFQVTVNPFPVNAYPYTESFDNDGGALPPGWFNEGISAFNWLTNSGGTASPGTGPLGDNTTGTGFYAYTEATGAEESDTASLVSRKIDLTGLNSPELSFSYHMNGTAMGTLRVNIIDAASDTINLLTLDGQQQLAQADAFIETSLSLVDYIDEIVEIQFEGIRGNDFTSDIAIDDVSIIDIPGDDLEVVSIDSPTNGSTIFGTQSITATIRNRGLNTQSDFDVVYTVASVEVGRETITDPFVKDEELEITFTDSFEFTTPGAVNIVVSIELASDEIPANNSQSIDVTIPVPITVIPYAETFDDDAGALPAQWTNENVSNFNWLVISGETGSGGTGPLNDNTTGTGFYVYTEATGAEENDNASLLSPFIDLDGLTAPELSFAYHMHGADMGTLNVNLFTESAGIVNILTLTGQQQVNQADNFTKVSFDLSAYADEVVRVQFLGTRGVGFTGDIAIDDFSVSNLSNNDMEVLSINSPRGLVFGDESISATFRNAGLLDQSNFEVAFSVDDLEIARETVTGTLTPGETLDVTFATTFDFSAVGDYSLEVEITSTGDENSDNDSIISTIRRALFTGDYTMIQLVNGGALTTNVFAANGINTDVFIDYVSENVREFNLVYAEGLAIGQPGATFQFTLNPATGDVVFGDNQRSNLQFGPTRPILFGPAVTPGVYDPTNESAFTLTLAEDITSETAVGTFETSFQLFMNTAPTAVAVDNLAIVEGLFENTVVGNITVTDENPNDVFSFILSGVDASTFAIGGVNNSQLLIDGFVDASITSNFNIQLTATDATGESKAQDFVITVSADPNLATWTGEINNVWNNPDNWSKDVVPTASTDVIIPNRLTISTTGGEPNDPTITTDSEVNDLKIRENGRVLLTANSLTINNDLDNDGSLFSSSETSVVLLGDRVGSGTENFTKSIGGDGELHLLGSPVAGNTIASLMADFVFDYNNDTQNFIVPGSAENLTPGNGLFVGYSGATSDYQLSGQLSDGDIDVTINSVNDKFSILANPYGAPIKASTFFANANNTANTTGTIYLWDDAGSNNTTGQRGGDYVTVNSMGVVGTFNPSNGLSGQKGEAAFNGNISSFQGFFIEAANTGSATTSFTPAMQTITAGNSDDNFFREELNSNILKLSIEGDGANQGLYSETLIGFNEKATFDIDYSLDAKKFSGNADISFFSLQNDESYAIQALPKALDQTFELVLGFAISQSGTYKLSVNEFTNVDGEAFKLFLNDNQTGISYDLSLVNKFSFDAKSTNLSKRFSITTSPNQITAIDDETLNANTLQLIRGNANHLVIGFPAASERLRIHDLAGKVIFDAEMNFENGKTVIEGSFKANTVYILRTNAEAIKFILK